MKNTKQNKIDPLFVIFEQHLFNFESAELDRRKFVETVVRDYFSFLARMKIIVPKSLEGHIIEELAEQIQTMLTKKIYGCLNISDYQKKIPSPTRGRAKKRYLELQAKTKTGLKDAA